MSDFEHPQEPRASIPPQMPIPPRLRTSGKATMAFLLGLMSFVFWIFTALPAVILALQAKNEMRRDSNLRGHGLANLGLLVSFIAFFATPIFLMFILITGGSFWSSPDSYAGDSDRIVHLHLSGLVADSPSVDTFFGFGGLSMSLSGLVDAIEDAEYDDSVVAMVITMDALGASLAQVEEMYAALELFKESGKPIYLHSESASMSTVGYAFYSVATHFNLVPTAILNLTGMYSESMYLKDGLEKIGVAADVVHIGDYKSAGEMVMRNGPSPAAEEAQNWMLDSLYESVVDMIARSRDFTVDEVRALIDAGPYTDAQAEKAGLIDSRMYMDELVAHLKDEFGEDIYFDNNYGSIYETTGQNTRSSAWYEGGVDGKIGLVFLEGSIYPGYGQAGAFSGTIRRALDAAAADSSIDAVVLRIDSPGGSVTASEVILRAVQKLQEKKPVVVSMGGVAASGGYYVACQADAIFANATTITGSIGVVGGKIVTTGLWDELGISWHPYKRGANADWISSAEPFTDVQRQTMTESMGAAYTTFKDHVMNGREDLLTKDLEEIAAGRVFTGKQALELGLIDEIGGLNDALSYAADLADLEDFDVQVIPRVMDFNEILMQELFGSGGDRPTDMSLNPLGRTSALSRVRDAANESVEQAMAGSLIRKFGAEKARAMGQFLQHAELLNEQGVAAVMPEVFVVH